MLKHILLALSSLCLITTSLAIGSLPYNTYVYKTVGNLSIEADVYVPNISLKNYPVALVIHGGGFVEGSKQDGCSEQELEEMLSRGWVVVPIDYRLAPDVYLADIVEDVQDAYAWIRNELVNIVPLDLDSFVVFGGSAGGALTLISGYLLSPRPQALIAFFPGLANFTEAYNATSVVPESLITTMDTLLQPMTEYNVTGYNPRILFFEQTVLAGKFGWMLATHDPSEPADSVVEYLQEYSAVYHVNSSYPPTVLVHGLNDTLVPYQESVNMAGYLAAANVPYALNLVPGAGHGFDSGNVTLQVWDDYILPAFSFAQKYLDTNSAVNTTISQ